MYIIWLTLVLCEAQFSSSLCDHTNFTRNGTPLNHLFASDGYHLSEEGTRVLSSNLRRRVEVIHVLNLPSRRRVRTGNRALWYR